MRVALGPDGRAAAAGAVWRALRFLVRFVRTVQCLQWGADGRTLARARRDSKHLCGEPWLVPDTCQHRVGDFGPVDIQATQIVENHVPAGGFARD